MGIVLRKQREIPQNKEIRKAKEQAFQKQKLKVKEPKTKLERETEIVIMLDASGSMSEYKFQVINFMNDLLAFILTRCPTYRLSIITFCNEWRKVLWRVPAALMPEIDAKQFYAPGGGTAICDTVCEVVGGLLSEANQSRVLFLLISDRDGENSSQKFHKKDVVALTQMTGRFNDFHYYMTAFVGGFSTTQGPQEERDGMVFFSRLCSEIGFNFFYNFNADQLVGSI